MSSTQQFDYIIVGAGSAGCVLASRLSEDPNVSVLLLEAGGSDNSIFIKMPTALSIPLGNRRYDWRFVTDPEPGLGGRQLDCPRGRVLGGSSSINGMVYARGHPGDFDEWEQLGASGWNYANCLPYFKRAEAWTGGQDNYRGDTGPLTVTSGRKINPLYNAFIRAGTEAGYGFTEDYNGYRQEGFGDMHMTVHNGQRWSAASAYLKPALKRANLKLVSHAETHRIIMEDRRATGVEYTRAGWKQSAIAKREVIVSAGAIGSPLLLQRSGIGPGSLLQDSGLQVVHNLPGVGHNLQDHLEIYFQYRCRQPITLNGKLGLVSKGMIGARWLLFRDGLGATNHFEACGFIRSRAGLEWPDIQYHFLPAAMRYDGTAALKGHGFQLHVGPNKPRSRGQVSIRRNDVAPAIQFNYLTDEQDVSDWRNCIRLSREILGQAAMDEYRGEEVQPGSAIDSDEDIDRWVQQNVESAYHPSCSCKMGSDDDPMAVLDADCRVRGIDQLRVVDASIFPSITNANLNAPTIMAAERAADIIKGKGLLPPQNPPIWQPPSWQHSQRESKSP